MPVLDILDQNGNLRWDAPGVLVAAIYFPREATKRAGYEAHWRADNKPLLPAGKRLLKKSTHDPARIFGGRAAIPEELKQRRRQMERIGTFLWLQAILSVTDPASATESKVSYLLGQLDGEKGIRTSRPTLKRDRARYRGVVHWCAAIAYQRRAFRAPLLSHPELGPPGYSIYAALWDFLSLGDHFFHFAKESGCFQPTQIFKPERDLWTLPPAVTMPRRDPSWPDCDRVWQSITPDPDILASLADYDATLYRAE